jgi:hypothetical protein
MRDDTVVEDRSGNRAGSPDHGVAEVPPPSTGRGLPPPPGSTICNERTCCSAGRPADRTKDWPMVHAREGENADKSILSVQPV